MPATLSLPLNTLCQLDFSSGGCALGGSCVRRPSLGEEEGARDREEVPETGRRLCTAVSPNALSPPQVATLTWSHLFRVVQGQWVT